MEEALNRMESEGQFILDQELKKGKSLVTVGQNRGGIPYSLAPLKKAAGYLVVVHTKLLNIMLTYTKWISCN